MNEKEEKDSEMKILFHFLKMFQLMKIVVDVVVVEVLYDDFQRFQEQLHRLNLDYHMFVLVHPKKNKNFY
jgi:hypothetical protein